MELRRLLTQAIESYTGQRPASVEFYEDPKVEGTIAVRADGADYLVHYGIPGHDFVVEEVEFATWPPTHSGGKPMEPVGPKYPHIVVKLIGTDGNAFAVMGAVSKALREAGISKEERDAFTDEATASDYNNLLATCMRWITIK